MSLFTSNTFDRCIAFIGQAYDRLDAKADALSKRRGVKYICWILVVLFFFTILFILNILTPMIADDFGYLVVYRENTPIDSLSDIIRSQYNHYLLWGGRSVVHFIAQVLLQLPSLVTDLLNTFVYLLYIYLIYIHIKGYGSHSLTLFILANFAVWFVQPAFGDTVLWVTGSANYLWGTVFILLFLLPFRLYNGRRQGMTAGRSAGLFAFGILAGWTNENTAGAMIVIALLYLVYFRSRGWNIPYWAIYAIVGAVIGYIIMILAPGNALRAGEAGELSLFLIVYRLLMHSLDLCINYGAFNVCYIIAIILFWRFAGDDRKQVLKLSCIYIVGALAGVYAMIFSPSFPPRAWFGVITFNIIAFGIILYNLNYDYRFIRQIRSGLLIMGSIVFIFTLYWAAKDVYTFHQVSKQREIIIAKAKANGEKSCEIDRYTGRSKFVHSEDLTANYLMWDYYGIEIAFRK